MAKSALLLGLALVAPDSSGHLDSQVMRLAFARSVPLGDEPAFGVALLRTRGLAAAGRRDGSVSLWNAWTWEEIRRFPAHDGFCYSAAFSPDGRRLATAGVDGAVKLWAVETAVPERTLRDSGGSVVALAFASGGTRLLAAGAQGTLVLDLEGGSTLVAGPSSSIATAGSRAAAGGNDGALRLWDLGSEPLATRVPAHSGVVTAVAFQPGGGKLVSGGVDRAIHVWDARTQKKLRTLSGHEGPVRSLAFMSGGAVLISAGADGVRLWDFASGRLLRALSMNGVGACAVSIGSGARPVVVTGADNRLWLWGTGGEKEPLPSDSRPVGFLGVSYVDGGGALVQGVFPDSPAERTGFLVNDVIVGVDETPIEKSEDFLNYMRRSHEGDDLQMKVKRGEETKIIRVKLSRWKDQ